MSTKRTSTETSRDEQTNEGSDSVFQQGNNPKRAKLASLLYDTKLQDLPTELLHRVLVEAVVMEVKAMELAKSAWKKKIDRLVRRLCKVCSQWSSILTTNFFRNEVNSYLDETAQTFRMEILNTYWTQSPVLRVTTMKDEIFLLCRAQGQTYTIQVYNRNNMAMVKDVIQLPDIDPVTMVGCSVSNCVYVLNMKKCQHIAIVRITKDDEHQFNISLFIDDIWQPHPTMTVTANGTVIISRQQWALRARAVISFFDVKGSLQHSVRLDTSVSKFADIVAKLNGNVVLVSYMYNDNERQYLTEVDIDGSVVSRYQHSGACYNSLSLADVCGRMVRTDALNRIQLLDSELNPLDFTCAQLNGASSLSLSALHFNSERNEVVGVYSTQNRCIVILRFIKE